MNTTEQIQAAKPYFPASDSKEMEKKIKEIFKTGQMVNGKFTDEFEELARHTIGTKYALSLNSCTSALQAIFQYIEIHGDEVIVPVNTFPATANAVLFAGGTPVFTDIDRDTLLLDFEKCIKRITPKTKALVLVHIAGYIHPQIEVIKAFCKEHNIFFIEDASHAHGASHSGMNAGSFGDAAAFSMFASKVITTGGVGGLLTTSNKNLYAFAKSVRFHGEEREHGIQSHLGNNWLITEMQAVVGTQQLRRLSEIVQKRMRIAKMYNDAFARMDGVRIFPLSSGNMCGYYKYPLRLMPPNKASGIRRTLKTDFGIAAGTCYWPPCHMQPIYKKLYGYKKGDFPVAENILSETLSLPIFTDMTNRQVHTVVTAVKKSVGE